MLQAYTKQLNLYLIQRYSRIVKAVRLFYTYLVTPLRTKTVGSKTICLKLIA